MARTPTYRFRPRVFELGPGLDVDLDPTLDPGDALTRLAGHRCPVFLDSASGWPSRFSLLAFDPLPLEPPARFEELGAFASELGPAEGDVPGPFHGGFAGALSYDLGVPEERQSLPMEPWDLPPIVGGLFTDFLLFDHERGGSRLVLGDEPGDGRPSVAERRAAIEAELAGEGRGDDDGRSGRDCGPRGPLLRHTPPEVHRARVAEVRRRIARGDFYQANLAHRFTQQVWGRPDALYRALRAANPAPYMGFCRWEGERPGALLSSSPELLLELGRVDGVRLARTRPIKGTVARPANPGSAGRSADEACAAALLASEKDRAELAMIVDLERNDLGRTAKSGTVRVEDFPELRTYERVHHLTADVVAEPADDRDAWDVIAALFPGGSITGAPKLASMEAIAELEGEGRGFFCGALGFVDTRGEARLNVLIRSALWRPRPGDSSDPGRNAGEISFRVGGGITFSSDPEREDEETLAKASAMVAAFAGVSLPASPEEVGT